MSAESSNRITPPRRLRSCGQGADPANRLGSRSPPARRGARRQPAQAPLGLPRAFVSHPRRLRCVRIPAGSLTYQRDGAPLGRMLTLCGRPIHCRCMIMQRRYSTAAEIWINHQLVVEGSGPREPWCGRLTCEIALRRTDRRRGSGRRSGRLGMRGVASGTQVQAYGFQAVPIGPGERSSR